MDEQFDIPAANLDRLFGPGTYSLKITGVADNVSASAAGGAAGPGSYNGSLSFAAATVPAVPEQATWGMMLIGFGRYRRGCASAQAEYPAFELQLCVMQRSK